MIEPKTRQRLIWLSRWNPPRGVTRLHVLHDDGTITIFLETERFQDSIALCPLCTIAGMHDLLDHIAVGLLDAEDHEAERPTCEAEARVEQQLACADSVFRAGLRKATRKDRRP